MAAMHFPAFRSLVLSLIAAAPVLAQQVDMRTTAKKGASVWLLQEQLQTQAFEVMGQEIESTQTIRRALHVTVDDVDADGNLMVTTKLVRVHGSITNPSMGDLEFDSAKPFEAPEDDPTGGMLTTMLKTMTAGAGKSFVAKVDPFGRVVQLVDTKAMAADGDVPAMEDGALKAMVEGAFGRRSDKPIAPGESWANDETDRGGRLPVVMKAKMVLAKADATAFELTSTGTIEKLPPAAEGEGEGNDQDPAKEMLRSMKLSNGKVTGTTKLSREDGFLLEAKLETSMDAEMSMGGMSVPMAIKQVTTTKRITEAEAMPKKAEAPKAAETPKPTETGK